jgi:hypothetical protein
VDCVVLHPADDLGLDRERAVLGGVICFRKLALDGLDDRSVPPPRRSGVDDVVVARHVDAQADFIRHLLGQVDRESVGVVKLESVRAGNRAPVRPRFLRHFGEQLQAAIERADELLFLILDRLRHSRRVARQFGERYAHVVHHRTYQFTQERLLRPEQLPAVPLRPPEDALQDVVPPLVADGRTVGQGERQRPDVVRDYPVRHVLQVCHVACVVRRIGDFLDRCDDRGEHVGVVVAVLALEYRRHPLEAHAGIDVLGRQRGQRAVLAPVELDEHQVPDLHHLRHARVDQLAARLVRGAVDVDLGTRPARAGVAHLPEVVLLRPVVDVRRVHARLLDPELPRLVVLVQALLRVAAEDGDVQPVAVEFPDLGEQLPRPADRLPLEVVPERPVPEHLEERVVVGVLAHVVQVVVLAAGPDALLGVRRPDVIALLKSQEDWLELVHPGVGEEQGGVVVRDDRAGRDERVPVLLHEEVDELLADLVRGRHGWPR